MKKLFLEFYNDRKQILFLSILAFVEYQTRGFFIQDDFITHATMGWIAVGGMVLSAGVGMYTANQQKQDMIGYSNAAKEERDKQQKLLEKQKDKYRAMKFENVYKDMENVYEDLTVNQQQAEFQAQQGAQQRANIMQSMKGAAGASGIAGLAQALANQGQLQTQRISASIGLQESANQRAASAGAAAAQAAERGGEQWIQEAEMSRQATLLGMQMGTASGANTGFAQAQANQMQAQMAQSQALASGLSGIATTATSLGQNEAFMKKYGSS